MPQDLCLGSLLFSVYINDLPYCINHGIYLSFTLTIQAYLHPAKNDVEKLINLNLDNIHNWLVANKLSINVEKTKCKLGQCPDLTIKINGSEIKQVDRKDCLTSDEKLKWDKYMISSAISGIKLARFLPVSALKELYNSLVESRLRYCCTVWG